MWGKIHAAHAYVGARGPFGPRFHSKVPIRSRCGRCPACAEVDFRPIPNRFPGRDRPRPVRYRTAATSLGWARYPESWGRLRTCAPPFRRQKIGQHRHVLTPVSSPEPSLFVVPRALLPEALPPYCPPWRSWMTDAQISQYIDKVQSLWPRRGDAPVCRRETALQGADDRSGPGAVRATQVWKMRTAQGALVRR